MASQSLKENMDTKLSPHIKRTNAIHEAMYLNFPNVLTDMIGEYTRPIPWIEEGKVEEKVLEGHTRGVRAVTKISEDIVVSGSEDNTLRVWNIKTGKCLKVLEGHTRAVTSVSKISEDIVVSGSGDKTLIVWRWKED